MESQRRCLLGVVLVNAISFACADEDMSLVEREPDQDNASSEHATDDAASSDEKAPMDDSPPAEAATQSDLLQSTPDAPAPAPTSNPASDFPGSMGSESAPGEGSDAGPAAPPTKPTPPSPADAVTPPLPLPDLVLDAAYLEATIQQSVVDATLDSCLINEGCVTGVGLRRVIRFGTRSGNIGTADLVAGRPELNNTLWEFDACHAHFHFEDYAHYDLIDAATGVVQPVGVKNGFCLQDFSSWDGSVPSEKCRVYDCNYQGIGVGCSDTYVPELDCQWVDITDIAPGEYDLRVTINPAQRIQELDRSNNSASVRILITPETVRPVR